MEDREHDELRLLYSTAVEDIRYSKQQQWKIIHLTLLAIAGLVSFHRVFKVLPSYLLVVLTIGVAVVGIWFLCVFTFSLQRYRAKKEIILKTFTKEAQSLESRIPKKWVEKMDWVIFLSVMMLFIGLATSVAIKAVLRGP